MKAKKQNAAVEVREARGHYGFRGRIVVPRCPYCGCEHYHSSGGASDDYRRLADCYRGEYVIRIK